MKKILRLVAFFATFLMTGTISAQVQHQRCGLHEQDRQIIEAQLLRNKAILASRGGTLETRAVIYVPVIFHLVAKTDGTGRLPEARVMEELCALNEIFSDQELQFYLRPSEGGNPPGINYINNSSLYDAPRLAGDNARFALRNKKNDAINIFIVNSATTPGSLGTMLGYYQNSFDSISYSADWIVQIKGVTGYDALTLAHQMGHFFSLVHTHNGWDTGALAFSTSRAPAVSPDGRITENVARDNCNVAGDFLCDTPADYNGLNASVSGTACTREQNWYDPTGIQLKANNNIMSYFSGCAGYVFSSQQKAIIRLDLTANTNRAYIRRNFTPALLAATAVPTLISPLANAVQPFYNAVRLNWNAVPNAQGYMVEISPFQTFDINLISVFSPSNSIGIDNAFLPAGQAMLPNRTYYWRVRPVVSYASAALGCTRYSVTSSFRTSAIVSTQELEGVKTFSVSPNPIERGQALNIEISMQSSLEATVRLTDIAGKTIRSEKRTFAAGTNRFDWRIEDLSAGMYILSVENAEGIASKKVVVTN
ncbi:MAG: hypothetical protein RL757_2556 [Bacteroidota bacterium]